jgi:hypothetical protein
VRLFGAAVVDDRQEGIRAGTLLRGRSTPVIGRCALCKVEGPVEFSRNGPPMCVDASTCSERWRATPEARPAIVLQPQPARSCGTCKYFFMRACTNASSPAAGLKRIAADGCGEWVRS